MGNVSDEKEPSEKEPSEKEYPQKVLSDEGKMWQDLLNDGPFINLMLLAKAILSQDIVDPSSLSMCWKTLDMLRSEFRIDRADVSAPSLKLFNEMHEETHRRVVTEEPGFSVVPLLEVLDAVDGGRRLSKVFQDHPNPKYRSKAADLVFGKDHLRDPDLFYAFAKCLPHFITEHPDKSTEFMEGLVCYDHLWISLQVHLSNSLRPNGFTPAVLRVFDTCCTVIDAAFVALETSKVDWRAPNFGSLAHYFELFVTDRFRGMFIERAIAFRVGLIKARFCRAVLAQFLNEFKTEGTVIFRSHWDVAALARIFYSLGVSSDADVEFWKSFVDGGPVGVTQVAKTHTTLDTAKRDGPLLNFCKLGYLGLMAVPFKGSGLTDTDFKNLLALMQKMTEDLQLPLTQASTPAWEELDRLRREVADTRTRIGVRVLGDEFNDIFETSDDEGEVMDIFETSGNEDETNMKALLRRIDKVIRHRPLSTFQHSPNDHVPAQASGTSTVTVVQLNSPSSGPIPGHDRSGSTFTSTVISEDRRNTSPVQEIDLRGITLLPFDNARGVFANVYRNPYPHLPSQIGPGGTITRPFYASFLPNLFPHPGSTGVASPGTPSSQPLLPHVRYNSEHHLASVYYPPKVDNQNNGRSASLLSSRSPARMLSTSSNMLFGPTSNNVVYSSAPRTLTLPVEEEIQ